jgi:AmmeMemoRadiSam system protein B
MSTEFPRLRNDLRVVEAHMIHSKRYRLIRDVILEGWAHPGYRISQDALRIAECCDGQTPIEQLPTLAFERWGYRITHKEVVALIERLDRLYLLENDRSVQAKHKLATLLASKEVRMPACTENGYPGDRQRLLQEIRKCFLSKNGPGHVPTNHGCGYVSNLHTKFGLKGLIVPHGILTASGACAAWGYYELAKSSFPDLFILLGPNHAYETDSIEILRKDFLTPLGRVQVDQEFSSKLIENCPIYVEDGSIAHYREHSIEMQLPFLQYISQFQPTMPLRIVPIILSKTKNRPGYPPTYEQRQLWQALAQSIRKTIAESQRSVCIIASGDFTHYGVYHNYIPFKSDVLHRIESMDKGTIALIEKGQAEEFLNRATLTSYCCTYPIYVLLNALDTREIKLLRYHVYSCDEGDLLVNTFASLSFR